MKEVTLTDTVALDIAMTRIVTARADAAVALGNGKVNTGDKGLDGEVAEKLDEALDEIEKAMNALEAAYKYVAEGKRLITEYH